MTARSARTGAAAAAILALALAVRAPGFAAAHPYLAYVDEGHVLHPVERMLREGTWDPGWYGYPSLPLLATAAAARLIAPLAGWDLRAPVAGSAYDLVQPPGLILVGRLASLLVGLAIVAVTGLWARRLAGDRAGLLAALVAALVPALVVRSAIVIVDPWAALFATAALALGAALPASRAPLRLAAAAGFAAGLAAASKYPSGAVLLGVLASIALAGAEGRQRMRLAALAVLAAMAGTLAGMPALATRLPDVLEALRHQAVVYAASVSPSYWRQAVSKAEWDLAFAGPELGLPLLAVALAGLAVSSPPARRGLAGWLVFAAALGVALAGRPFQPFRNLLPLVPGLCVLAALAADALLRRLPAARRPLALALAALVAAPLACFLPLLLAHGLDRARLVDSRTRATGWLAARPDRPGCTVVLEELAVHPVELARLPGCVVISPWRDAAARLADPANDTFLWGTPRRRGQPLELPAAAARELASLRTRLAVGHATFPLPRAYHRGNAIRVLVLERRQVSEIPSSPPAGP